MNIVLGYYTIISIFIIALTTITISSQQRYINKIISEKVPASCYINESQHMYCINEDGEQVPITLYRSHRHTWDNYGKAQ